MTRPKGVKNKIKTIEGKPLDVIEMEVEKREIETHTFTCGNCKKLLPDRCDYCLHCGAHLGWSKNNGSI